MQILDAIFRRIYSSNQLRKYPLTLDSTSKELKGTVLFSYIPDGLLYPEQDPYFRGHSNKRESREIALIFSKLGYAVEAIDWTDQMFYPAKHYDVIFDIHMNLQRLAPLIDDSTIKLLHLTGSYPSYQNNAEIGRVQALECRRDVRYFPKRVVAYSSLEDRGVEIADACTLIGNARTLATYPDRYREKITLITVTASEEVRIKQPDEYVPEEREFLWFFGSGAVHKGLDLVLEVFAQNPDLTLNIVGDIGHEKDFMKIYQRELTILPNIKRHGYLLPNNIKFNNILKKVFCFIAPSCSEAISTAAATCMQIGLYPIVSYNTGITLPDQCGIYLETCSIEEIQQTVRAAYRMPPKILESQIRCCQKYALEQYSRRKFSQQMTDFLSKTLS